MFCSNCGTQVHDDAVVCINCGCAIQEPATNNRKIVEDKANVGLCVLSVFIPLFGIIYWALQYKETPKMARACGITALISWGVSIVLGIVLPLVFSYIMLSAVPFLF